MADPMTDPRRSHEGAVAFTVLSRWHLKDRGTVHSVQLDRDYQDFSSLIGAVVLLDGVPFKVRGVERFAHTPPWRTGEYVGLLADEVHSAAPPMPPED